MKFIFQLLSFLCAGLSLHFVRADISNVRELDNNSRKAMEDHDSILLLDAGALDINTTETIEDLTKLEKNSIVELPSSLPPSGSRRRRLKKTKDSSSFSSSGSSSSGSSSSGSSSSRSSKRAARKRHARDLGTVSEFKEAYTKDTPAVILEKHSGSGPSPSSPSKGKGKGGGSYSYSGSSSGKGKGGRYGYRHRGSSSSGGRYKVIEKRGIDKHHKEGDDCW